MSIPLSYLSWLLTSDWLDSIQPSSYTWLFLYPLYMDFLEVNKSIQFNSIFNIQKRTIRVITNSGTKVSCHELFKKFHILPLTSQYIFSSLTFVVKNIELFKLKSGTCHIETRYNNDFHSPSAKLNLFQKGVFYSGIKLFNHLPSGIKDLSHDIKQFKGALKRFTHSNSFYSLEEYFSFNW